jgi:two-component system response regulator
MRNHQYILYIDDDLDDWHFLHEAIDRLNRGIKLKYINSGDLTIPFLMDAIKKDEIPGLIILDVNMPGLDGRKTMIEIQKILPRYVPIIFLTTTPREDDIELGITKAVALLAKPTHLKGYDDLAVTILNLYLESD